MAEPSKNSKNAIELIDEEIYWIGRSLDNLKDSKKNLERLSKKSKWNEHDESNFIGIAAYLEASHDITIKAFF